MSSKHQIVVLRAVTRETGSLDSEANLVSSMAILTSTNESAVKR